MNSKKKGNLWENKLSNWFRDHGLKTFKDGASGGGSREKGDIGNNLDLTIESKSAKNISLMDWWRQVEKSASIHHNSPVLFIHQDGMADNSWLVVMHSEDWMDMFKNSRSTSPKTATGSDFTPKNDRELKWELERLKSQISKVSKLLD